MSFQRLAHLAVDTEEKAKKEAEEKARLAEEEKQKEMEAQSQTEGAAGKADKKAPGGAQNQVNGTRPSKSDNARGKNAKEKSPGRKQQNGEWNHPGERLLLGCMIMSLTFNEHLLCAGIVGEISRSWNHLKILTMLCGA